MLARGVRGSRGVRGRGGLPGPRGLGGLRGPQVRGGLPLGRLRAAAASRPIAGSTAAGASAAAGVSTASWVPAVAGCSGAPVVPGAFLGQITYVRAISPWMPAARHAAPIQPCSGCTRSGSPTYRIAAHSSAVATAAPTTVPSQTRPSWRARAMP